MNITFVGGGNMASALIGGMIAKGTPAQSFRVVDPAGAQRDRLVSLFSGIEVAPASDRRVIDGASIVVLAVKPQEMPGVARELAPHVGSTPVILSVAAGIRTADLARWLSGYRQLVRAMPNTPALVGSGISGLFATPEVSAERRVAAASVVEACGEIVWCDEEALLDAVTGVSGSGPAYVFYFLEAMEQAARELGLDAPVARKLTYATFAGAISLARQSDEEPAVLRARVTSKGGTTARGIETMEAAKVNAHFVAAIKGAAARAKELGDEFGAAR